jgi:trimeric autotransporter adhesin
LDDEVRGNIAQAADVVSVGTSLTITQAKTVTIDASVDTTSAGGANPSTITALTASNANSNVTVNAGVNGVTFAGTNTTGTGTLTVTGSGAVAFGSGTLTAKALDASTVTGAVSGTALDLANVADIRTGSGSDTLTVAAGSIGSFTVSTGAGTDSLTLPASKSWATTGTVVSIDLGEGTSDTLVIDNGTVLSAGTGGSITIAGVEKITLGGTASGESQTLPAAYLSGATVAIEADAASAAGTLVAAVARTATALNFSTLVTSEAVGKSLTSMTLNADASANTSAITITGATKMKNSLEGSAAGDTLTGGTLNDTFSYNTDNLLFDADGVMQDSIVGGAGNADLISVGETSASAFTIAATDVWSKISGVEKIVAAVNSTGMSITLDVTAETAGITAVDISASTSTSNVVNVAEYVSTGVTITGDTDAVQTITGGGGADTIGGGSAVDSIVGGAGNDRITSGGGADSLSGGLGDDTFSVADPLAPASTLGGDGQDTIAVTLAAGLTIADTVSFAEIDSVETMTVSAGTYALSLSLDSTAQTSGLRTFSVTATSTSTAAITVSAAEFTTGVTITGPTIASTLTGGSGSDVITGGAAADSITGGEGAETITGGGGNDTIIGSGGADIVVLGSSATANGVDVITWTTDDRLDLNAFLGSAYSIAVPGGSSFSPSSTNTNSITAFTALDNTAVNVAGKVVVWSAGSADAAASAPSASTILAEFGASTDSLAFYLTTGKAVVIAEDIDTNDTDPDDYAFNIFYVDAMLDGVAGVSSADIVLVGTTSAVVVGSGAFTVASFAGSGS